MASSYWIMWGDTRTISNGRLSCGGLGTASRVRFFFLLGCFERSTQNTPLCTSLHSLIFLETSKCSACASLLKIYQDDQWGRDFWWELAFSLTWGLRTCCACGHRLHKHGGGCSFNICSLALVMFSLVFFHFWVSSKYFLMARSLNLVLVSLTLYPKLAWHSRPLSLKALEDPQAQIRVQRSVRILPLGFDSRHQCVPPSNENGIPKPVVVFTQLVNSTRDLMVGWLSKLVTWWHPITTMN